MSTLERLKELSAEFQDEMSGISIAEFREIMGHLPKLLAVVEAVKDSGLITPDIERALMALDDHSV